MAAHAVEPPGRRDRRVAVAVGPEPWTARRCQRTGLARKGDPPRGLLRGADGGGARVLDRGDRVALRGSGDGAGGRVCSSRSGPRPSSAGCSRRAPGRSACRWRREPGSAGISPVSASPWGDPRPTVRRNEDTTDDAPGSGKTCDNPGWSSLCAFEDRGSSTRGLGVATPGPHLLLADGRVRRRPNALGAVDTGATACGHCMSIPALRHAGTAGSALRAEARPSVERGVRPGVKDPWIRKSPIQAPERKPRQRSAECSEKAVSA